MANQLANTPVFAYIKKEECCGCEGCANVCPVACITMKEDEEGFMFPFADTAKCLHCGLCEKICPVMHSTEREILKDTYAGFVKDDSVVKSSASGGAFSAIVRAFDTISIGERVICGVAWDNDYRGCHHEVIANNEDLSRLRTSKYVQSRKNDIYKEIKRLLSKGIHVLFSGTPCEVAALYMYLGREYQNLYTVDIVCQGPSSPKAMREYVDYLEHKEHKMILNVNMRYVHRTPWIPQWIKIDYEDGTEDVKVFYETEIGRAVHIMQRRSCYQCRFNGNRHYSDVTIGDYHGADPNESYYNPYGTSILVINTVKGKELVDTMLKDEPNFFETDYNVVAKTNPRLKESWKPHSMREQFGKWMQKDGLFVAAKNSWSLRQRVRRKIPYDVRMAVRGIKRKISGQEV